MNNPTNKKFTISQLNKMFSEDIDFTTKIKIKSNIPKPIIKYEHIQQYSSNKHSNNEKVNLNDNYNTNYQNFYLP